MQGRWRGDVYILDSKEAQGRKHDRRQVEFCWPKTNQKRREPDDTRPFGNQSPQAKIILGGTIAVEALDCLHRARGVSIRAIDNPQAGSRVARLEMPKVDGLEVLRQIKSDARVKRHSGRHLHFVQGTG